MEEEIDRIKNEFQKFLLEKVSKETTVSQYLSKMIKIQNWFVERGIVEKDFNIWNDRYEIEKINDFLNDESKSGWKGANKSIKNWMSSPWNKWVEFNNNSDIEKNAEIDSTGLEVNLLEKFADWLIERNGVSHNYFSDSFGSKKSNLINQLNKYENVYKKQFGIGIFNLANQNTSEFISNLDDNLYLHKGNFYEYSSKISAHMPRAIFGRNNYIKFLKELKINDISSKIKFNYKSFHQKAEDAGLIFSEKMVARFVASLCTKPFVICSGLSGSGKTKLAQAFVQWISESEAQYKIIPVGADWTNREPLLGFPNGLEKAKYVKPDSGALDIILKALKAENVNKPFFLILDEMNLSHVERYFADFLSIMESKDKIKLYSGAKRDNVDEEIKWPKNLFIIGTVNIDETTYMFSPKVLDRANVIEFRISEDDLTKYLGSDKVLDMDQFLDDTKTTGLGANMSESFLSIAFTDSKHSIDSKSILLDFFRELQKVGAEFGYRSAFEINRLIGKLNELSNDDNSWDGENIDTNEFIDIAIMQKLLPKLHGSRTKLTRVLPILGSFCLSDKEKIKENYFDKVDEINFAADKKIIYKLSFEKICRMYKNAVENGYASYAEA